MKGMRSPTWPWLLAILVLPPAMADNASAGDPETAKTNAQTGKPARMQKPASAGDEEKLDLRKLRRKKAKGARVDLFSGKSIYPAPPPPPPPKPVEPVAPPLPFRFMGKLVDGGNVTLFLAIENQEYSLRLNDVLNNTYRLDQINEDSAVFTYLPLDTRQTLSIRRKD